MLETINTIAMTYLPLALLIIGVLAFLVSLIVQVIKNVGFLKRVPTDAVVIVLSILLTVVLLLAYASYMALVILWYYILAAIIAGFIVAYVAMFGWSKLYALYVRFKGPKV